MLLHTLLFIFLLIPSILSAKGENPFTANFHNPLIVAIQKGSIEDITSLIDKGYNLNTRENNITPLLMASYNNNIEIVKYLMQKGVDVNSSDYEGNTPLHVAYEHPSIIDILIKNGANLFKKNKHNKNALEIMLENNSLDSIQILSKYNIFDKLNITERNNLLKLTTSNNIKQIVLSNDKDLKYETKNIQLGHPNKSKLSHHKICEGNCTISNNKTSNITSITKLANEDFVELPAGSSIILTNNNIEDKKEHILINDSFNNNLKHSKLSSTSQTPSLAKNSIHDEKVNSVKEVKTISLPHTPSLSNNSIHDEKVDSVKEVKTTSLPPTPSLSNNSIHDEKVDSVKEIKTTSLPQTPSLAKNSKQSNSSTNFHLQSTKLLESKKIKNSTNNSLKTQKWDNIFNKNNNSVWVEVKLIDDTKISMVREFILKNLRYPVRIQIIKPLATNNYLISMRAGPIHSFETARKLCKSTDKIGFSCIITDKLHVQTF